VSSIVHGTAIAIDGHGVLLTGHSGAGKSDLALRLIDRGAMLISDDAVVVGDSDGLPWLGQSPNIAGKLEVRGVGICQVPSTKGAQLRLVVHLVEAVERMPEVGLTEIAGFHVPSLQLLPFEVSAAVKLEFALRSVVDARPPRVPIDRLSLKKA
jgi:HPr kinase/phosphorylase